MILNKLRLNAAKVFGLSIVLAIAKCIAFDYYTPTLGSSAEINVNLQGSILDGQQMFYSVYNGVDKTQIVKNQVVNRGERNFKIILPLMYKTTLSTNINDSVSRYYKYDVIIYGVRNDKYDIAVPFSVEFNFGDIGVRRVSGGVCHYYYTNISQEVKLLHSKEIEIKLAKPEFNIDGDVYKGCAGLAGFDGRVKTRYVGNRTPNKTIKYLIDINLNYSIKDFLTMKKKPIEEMLNKNNEQF